MPNDQDTFDALVKTAQRFAPKFKVISKQESWLHRLIGFFNKLYMTQYWTTVGSTVAYPVGNDRYPAAGWRTIPHEGRHAIQAKFSEFLFVLLYLCGHFLWFIVGAFLAAVVSLPLWLKVNWWAGLLPLSIILLASPIPFAYFRYRWEFEAYTLSIAIQYWTTGAKPSDANLDRIADQFVGWFYSWMWPFGRTSMMKKLRASRDLVMSDVYLKDEYNAAVLQTLKDCGQYRAPSK